MKIRVTLRLLDFSLVCLFACDASVAAQNADVSATGGKAELQFVEALSRHLAASQRVVAMAQGFVCD